VDIPLASCQEYCHTYKYKYRLISHHTKIGMSLTKSELNKRMLELRNLRKLYEDQRIQNTKLRAENKELKLSVQSLTQTVAELMERMAKLELRNEELLTMTFGKKRERKGRNDPTDPPSPPKVRTTNSYTRPVPLPEDITKTEYHTLSVCPCGFHFSKTREKEYFVEDIVLPHKQVTRHLVTQGYCSVCRAWVRATKLPTTKVSLGENIQTYICYSNTILRLSYAQTIAHLSEVFHMHISQGEIAYILHKRAQYHEADYEALKTKVRQSPVIHLDETSDRVRDGDGYSAYTWLMQGKQAPEVVFVMGKTRGGGNARELVGTSLAVGVTDDYGVYKNLFEEHQLCWAHLHRKLRDLATSSVLESATLLHCQNVYKTESALYTSIRQLADRDDLEIKERTQLVEQFTTELTKLAIPHKLDPYKLATYKQTLAKNIPQYLTCIRLPNVPCDNNQAERSLRHVVLKRKTSFGCITEKGARTMSILMSVCLTIRNRIRETNEGFFTGYARFSV
jgi:transposase